MARSRRYGRGKGRGYYKFTPKRAAALKKAQFVSAKNRKGKGLTQGKKIAIGVGVLAGAAAIGYVGAKNYDKIGSKSKADWRKTSDPHNKEATRAANSVSVAHPSQTVSVTPETVPAPRMSTPITDSDRAKAAAHRQKERDKATRETRNVTGSSLNDIASFEKEAARKASENQIDRQVKGVLRATKRTGGTARITADNKVKSPLQLVEDGLPKATRGRRSGSLRGTPGGTQTPKKAVRPNTANGLTEAEHSAAIGFDTELYAPPTADFKRSRSVLGTSGLSGDPMQALRGIRAEDEKLLNPEPPKKKAPKKSASKPKAPTTGTNTTANSKPKAGSSPAPKQVEGMPTFSTGNPNPDSKYPSGTFENPKLDGDPTLKAGEAFVYSFAPSTRFIKK
jgi:hypothetical protein